MRTQVRLSFVFFPRSRSSLEPTRSFVSDSVTPGTITLQAPLSIRFSRQEYWSGLPFPSPGDLPCPGIEPVSPTLQMDSYCLSYQGSPSQCITETPRDSFGTAKTLRGRLRTLPFRNSALKLPKDIL